MLMIDAVRLIHKKPMPENEYVNSTNKHGYTVKSKYHGNAKVPEEEKILIKDLYFRQHKTQRFIAEHLGRASSTVSMILRDKKRVV